MNETKSKIGKDELKEFTKYGCDLKMNIKYRASKEMKEIAETMARDSTLTIVVREKLTDENREAIKAALEVKKNIILDVSDIDL